MKKFILILLIAFIANFSVHAQSSAKVIYAELGGPGVASINYDMRFKKQEDGLGFRAGIGGFSLSENSDGSKAGILFVPLGINYLLGKDQKNYFEIGADFTYVNASSKDPINTSQNFNTSFGSIILGYRLAPVRGGFSFRGFICPVFGSWGFDPLYGGISFGYKF